MHPIGIAPDADLHPTRRSGYAIRTWVSGRMEAIPMQKSKHTRSLFDRLSDDGGEISGKLQQSGRWSSQKRPVERVSGEDSASGAETLRYVENKADVHQRRSPLVLVGNRIEVSLTPWSFSLVIAVAVVLLACSFELGSRSGNGRGLREGYQQGRASLAAESMTEIDVVRGGPVAAHVVSDLTRPVRELPAKVNTRPETGAAPRWITGYTYVVAQGFTASQASDVEAVQDFLAERGIQTASVRYPGGAVHLITTMGFYRKEPAQREAADLFLKKIHRVGKEYRAAGGRYSLDGYFKTLTGDSW